MNSSHLWLCLFLLFPMRMTPQATSRPRPPGITEGQKGINQPLEPPAELRNRHVDIVQVKQETEELRKLANALPAQIDQVANNQLPRDLNDNLKKIEKLAKHLRSEVTP